MQIPGASSKPESNTCDSVSSPVSRWFIFSPLTDIFQTSLAYSCVCSNGQQPNASQYSQTIPYYECTQAATDCVNACPQGDSGCQSACRTSNPCGAQNPVRVNVSTTTTLATTTSGSGPSSTADSTATGQNTFTGFGGSPTGTSKSAGAARTQDLALGFGRTYGLATVLAGVCGGFMLLL